MKYAHKDIDTEVIDNRLSLSKWDGEATFSIKHSGKVNHYPIRKLQPTYKLRWLDLGGIDPTEVPIEYELSHHHRPDDIQISTYWSNAPALMYFGAVPAQKYTNGVDIPEVRAVSRDANPYYMDEGLVMFDVHYNGHEINYHNALNQAMIDVLREQGIETFNKGWKLYYKDPDGNDVKIASPETAEGHTWTYLNLDTEYNHAYDFYKDQSVKPNDTNAYGLKRNYPDISKEVVPKIVERFAQLASMLTVKDEYTISELREIERLKKIHTDSKWVKDGKRDDPGYSYFDDEGHEYEIILDRKPSSNVVSIEVETKNLVFYYQPKETAENARRPIHVEGSFAAYHINKTKHHTSARYKVGKAFHIYAPVAIDADGNKVKCFYDPSWDGTKNLEITIPQDFLDNAVYPVTIDPTMGYTTAGGSSTQLTTANSYQALVSITGFTGSPKTFVWYGNINSAGQISLVGALYTVAAVRTDYTAQTQTSSLATGWQFWPTTQGSTLSNAVSYDIGLEGSMTPSSYVGYNINYDTSTNAGGATTSNTYSSPPPATQPTLTTNNNKYSFYLSTLVLTSSAPQLAVLGVG